jgi:exopolysaccharide biosynthesis polyprenyl glycosylphosphotransferase
MPEEANGTSSDRTRLIAAERETGTTDTGNIVGSVIALPGLADERARRARRVRLALITLRLIADGVLLVVAFMAAYTLRYVLEFGRDVVAPESYLPLSAFTTYIVAFTGMTLLSFQMRGLYSLPRGASWFDQMRIIAGATLVGVAALTLGALLFNPVLPSRMLFLFLWFVTIAIFSLERFGYRGLRVWLWRHGHNVRRTIVVGSGLAGQRIMKDIVEHPELGYQMAGYVTDSSDSPSSVEWRIPIRHNGGLERLGSLKDVRRIIEQKNLHEVIVALPATHHTQILGIIDSCREYGVDFKLVPDLFEMRFNEVRIDALNDVPLIGVKDVALRGFNLFVKRVLDIVLTTLALAVAGIPMLFIALLIKMTSPGPVIFRQTRVGKNGEPFVCYKFRTMYRDAEERKEHLRAQNEADGPVFKMKNDPRRTSVGKVLRRTSLDELPNLFNILQGEMSWVGPRPPTPDEVEQYNDWHRKRLDVTPGLTGLWQVSGRSDLTFEEMVKLDLYYAENWSLALDTKIILKTIPVVLKREGAY